MKRSSEHGVPCLVCGGRAEPGESLWTVCDCGELITYTVEQRTFYVVDDGRSGAGCDCAFCRGEIGTAEIDAAYQKFTTDGAAQE